jgi:hypothetical protein
MKLKNLFINVRHTRQSTSAKLTVMGRLEVVIESLHARKLLSSRREMAISKPVIGLLRFWKMARRP